MFSHPFGLYQHGDTFDQSIARVCRGARGVFEIGTPHTTLQARFTGQDPPVVGDWVLWRGDESGAVITEILPRTSEIRRKAAGASSRVRVLAANLHYLLIVTAPDRDFNPRRLERYLAMAWEGGVTPVLVLNKLDLCNDPTPFLDELETVAPGVDIQPMAAIDDVDLTHLAPYSRDGRTIALVGSSGVGKSTIVNRLLGDELMRTGKGREGDGKGRHTTTHRELHRLEDGGIVIDTPGLREIQPIIGQEALDQTFVEIPDQARACKFRNCSHQGEPGCAVQAAIDTGDLDQARLDNYHKLGREMRYQESRSDKQAKLARKRADKALHKHIRTLKHR